MRLPKFNTPNGRLLCFTAKAVAAVIECDHDTRQCVVILVNGQTYQIDAPAERVIFELENSAQ